VVVLVAVKIYLIVVLSGIAVVTIGRFGFSGHIEKSIGAFSDTKTKTKMD
jgi:hypothetical protein